MNIIFECQCCGTVLKCWMLLKTNNEQAYMMVEPCYKCNDVARAQGKTSALQNERNGGTSTNTGSPKLLALLDRLDCLHFNDGTDTEFIDCLEELRDQLRAGA